MKSGFINTKLGTFVCGVYILETIIFNFSYDESKFLGDLWFVTHYSILTYFFYRYRNSNSIWSIAFLISALRMCYNILLMFGFIEYDAANPNNWLLISVVLIFFITDGNKISKWLRLHTLSLLHGLRRFSYSLLYFFK